MASELKIEGLRVEGAVPARRIAGELTEDDPVGQAVEVDPDEVGALAETLGQLRSSRPAGAAAVAVPRPRAARR